MKVLNTLLIICAFLLFFIGIETPVSVEPDISYLKRSTNLRELDLRPNIEQVINLLYEQEPILATACVPSCIYRSRCPELKSCGYIDSQGYDLAKEEYCNVLM